MAKARKQPSAKTMLGSLEYRVMTALWRKAPASVDDVRLTLNKRRTDEWAYTTIMTVLSRLHDKELVSRERLGRAYEYTPLFTEAELVAHLSQNEVADLVDRYGDVALAQFASALENASPETRERIASLTRTTPDEA